MVFKDGKKILGKYDPESKVFLKDNVKKSKHLFRALNAWAIDYEILKKLPLETRILIEEQ